MPKNDEEQIILDYIVDGVTFVSYGEDGDEYIEPLYVRVDDIVAEFNVDEEDIVNVAKEHGYMIFDNKSDVAEGLYIAHPDFNIQQFKDDFENFYDVEPEIEIVFQPETKKESESKEEKKPIEPVEEGVMCCSLCGAEDCAYNDPETSEPLCADCFAERCDILHLNEDISDVIIHTDYKANKPGDFYISEKGFIQADNLDTNDMFTINKTEAHKFKSEEEAKIFCDEHGIEDFDIMSSVKEDTIKQGSSWVNSESLIESKYNWIKNRTKKGGFVWHIDDDDRYEVYKEYSDEDNLSRPQHPFPGSEMITFYDYFILDKKTNKKYTKNDLGLKDDSISTLKKWVEKQLLKEDTVKQGSHWVNKGKEGTHGTFKTKKAADAQRKAMFANGYKESLEEDGIIKLDNVTAFWDSYTFNEDGNEYFYEIEYHADEDRFIYSKVMDTTTLDCSRDDMKAAGVDVEDIEAKLKAKLGNVEIDEDYDYTYWCVSDGVNPRHSMIFTSEDSAIEAAKANPRFKIVDKVVNGNPTTIWERGKEEFTESKQSEVVAWWKDVEAWNKDNKYNIDNGDYSDVDSMHAAMFDMLKDLKGEVDEEAKKLFKKGKSIYNKYAISQFNESLEVEWCVMDRDGNNKFDCFTDKEEAINHCNEIEDAFSVVEVHYNDEGEEISAETVFEKDFSENLKEAKEIKPDIPEDFDGKMDYLAADEQEAIDGYELVIAALGDDEANVKEQLEKIKIEEIAHKEFLEKVKADHNLIYTEPLDPEQEPIEESFEVGDEWDWQDGGFVAIEDKKEDKYLIRTPGGEKEWVSEEELKNRILTGRKAVDGKHPFADADSLYEDKKKVTSSEIEAFINDIYNLRKEGMETEGEYSLQNLVFKEMRALGYLDHLKDLRNMLKGEELSLESLTEAHETPTDEDIEFLRNWLDLGKESYLKGFDPDNQTAFIVFPKGVSIEQFDEEGSVAPALRSRGFKVDLSQGDYAYKTVGTFNSREMKTTGKGRDRVLKDRVRMDISWAPYPIDEELNTSKYNTREKLAQLRKDYPEDGTYSVDRDGNITREELSDGFMVSFFRPEIKDNDIAVILKTIGTKLGSPYLGIFEDAPEISYKFDDEDKAMKFARLFNQKSIWDNEHMIEIANPNFKKTKKVYYQNLLDKIRKFINPSTKPVDESFNSQLVDIFYPNLTINVWVDSENSDDEIEIEYSYEAYKEDVIDALFELLAKDEVFTNTEEQELIKYIEDNFDDLVDKHMDYLCDYFEDSAIKDAEENYEPYSYEPDYED